jgi:hypothetical protein
MEGRAKVMGKAYALIVRNGAFKGRLDVVVVAANGLNTEWPIMYDDGTTAYDHPEIIPKYIKPKVRRLLMKIRDGKVRPEDISDVIAPPPHDKVAH